MSSVYFLRPVGLEGPVKIGFSASPRTRLEQYMPWAPFPLEIAATIPGDGVLERRFHALFEDQRTHHEWFTASVALTAVIAAIQSGAFDCDTLPAPKKLKDSRVFKPWSEVARVGASWNSRLRWLQVDGVKVPSEVSDAVRRYRWGHNFNEVSGRQEDRDLVEGFLEAHPRTSRRRRAA